MAIDKTGKWWVGSDAGDVLEYLVAHKAEGYAVDEVRLCKCICGSEELKLAADREEGCAQRFCAKCGSEHFICDSAVFWEDAEPENWNCTQCDSEIGNIGVGFSLYAAEREEQRDVRWVSVGVRCVGCGTLGCFADWKVGYGPSQSLLEQA
jgi:hypothetical protein